jgi:pimeloyl-ACP methyl ester carboxylesterase
MIHPMYQATRPSRSEFIPIRHLRYHVRLWGQPQPGVAPLVLVHGWMDVAASFQFLVDALSDAFASGRLIIAPDWRGFGLTTGAAVDHYWFHDYLADLDALLDHYSPGAPVDLVGHSLGGNVVMHYAGARSERLRRLVNLEGFGVPAPEPASAPKRLAGWMDQLKALKQGEMALQSYAALDGVARRLMKTNPRLARDEAGRDRALWLAQHWAAQDEAGGPWRILGDAAHKIAGPLLSRVEEVQALYANIAVPTLFVDTAEDSLRGWYGERFTLAEFEQRIQHVPHLQQARIADAGHMLHHDQPEALARLIEGFLA